MVGDGDPSALDAADFAQLRERLGRARLRHRLNAQVYHVAGEAHQDAILLGLSRVLDIDAMHEGPRVDLLKEVHPPLEEDPVHAGLRGKIA